jgi:hypothetical protein
MPGEIGADHWAGRARLNRPRGVAQSGRALGLGPRGFAGSNPAAPISEDPGQRRFPGASPGLQTTLAPQSIPFASERVASSRCSRIGVLRSGARIVGRRASSKRAYSGSAQRELEPRSRPSDPFQVRRAEDRAVFPRGGQISPSRGSWGGGQAPLEASNPGSSNTTLAPRSRESSAQICP